METKSAQVFTKNDEDRFWETGTFNTGTFNTDTPQGLQNAVCVYVSKVCCLHGGKEEQELVSLFVILIQKGMSIISMVQKIVMEVFTS